MTPRRLQCGARADEGVQHRIPGVGEQFDEPLGQGDGESGAVLLVATFRGQMQHIGRISHLAPGPVGDVLAKAAANLRVVANDVVFAERFQTGVGPVAHRHHHGFLIHLELARFGEVQATFPGIAETVRPFAGITVFLVPDILFRPQPTLLAQGEDEFDHVGMTFSVFGFFLDVKYKGTGPF